MTRRLGLIVFALLSVHAIADLELTDGERPPYAVAGAVLGVASSVLAVGLTTVAVVLVSRRASTARVTP